MPSPIRTIKPAADRRVRDPADPRMAAIPAGGKTVTWSSYWQRALDAGDVVEVKAEAPAAKGVSDAPPAPPAADKGAAA